MKEIKILMVLSNTGRAGSQTFVMNILRAIDRDRFQIDLAVSYIRQNGYQDEIEKLGGQIHLIPVFKGYNYFQFVSAWRKLAPQYDIIHGNITSSASIYLRIAKECGCKTIIHSHSDGYRGNVFERYIKKIFTKGAKKYGDLWFACSEKAACRVYGNSFKESNKYYEIPNAIVLESYKFDINKRNDLRKAYGISDTTLVCGHVGSFTLPKNHQFLLRVFAEIHKEHKDACLFLLGYGPLKKEINEQAQLLGISDKIIFTGSVNNPNEYMMAMDVFIFPSLFEGFGIALLESQATGLYSLFSSTLPEEIRLTDCAIPVSLDTSPEDWAKLVQCTPLEKRENYYQLLLNTKYNINNCISLLSELYTKLVSE